MSVPDNLKQLQGNWAGKNFLYLPWLKETPFESASQAVIDFSAKGIFLKIEYDWFYDEKQQEGLILIGQEEASETIKSFWIDSWHLSDKFMVSEGKPKTDLISVKGFYSVPEHPDWGWKTIFDIEDENSFKILMYNVSPEGDETLAVETEYARK